MFIQSILLLSRRRSSYSIAVRDSITMILTVFLHIEIPSNRTASAAHAVGAVLLYLILMNKTCAYCGIVPLDHVCPHRKKRHSCSADGRIEKFRSSGQWQRKREYIKERDLYLCQACRSGIDGEVQFNSEGLEVHHIDPLEEDFDRRLDDDNLITLCSRHHKMAEMGQISREQLRIMIPPS